MVAMCIHASPESRYNRFTCTWEATAFVAGRYRTAGSRDVSLQRARSGLAADDSCGRWRKALRMAKIGEPRARDMESVAAGEAYFTDRRRARASGRANADRLFHGSLRTLLNAGSVMPRGPERPSNHP